MPTRPDPAQPDEGPVLEPIHVLRPRRTDALAELFKELEQDGDAYERVPVPAPPPSGAEDATQELPAVAAGDKKGGGRGGGARPRTAGSGPGLRRTVLVVAAMAAAVVGFGGALLLTYRGDGTAAQPPAPSATAAPSAEPTRTPSGGSGDAGAPGADASAAPAACTASFRTVSSWQGGFQGEVTVTNAPASPVSGWTATVVPADGARLTQVWDGTLTTAPDGTATVANASWNGALAPGASVTFGFLADASASAGAPSAKVTCAATAGAS
ncbi:cellulose binding domain-containing protein [Streptomyces viridochromogenes]|uniref:cellulose binding domain-containing protein n=1 Tax=Streptomyces viridochromogenes TaxID=1938 RepID=UPI0002E58211|nr:cellulose binding domain-containing protein [Streptomyces viridochromogenes]